jgi:hypothetical protein
MPRIARMRGGIESTNNWKPKEGEHCFRRLWQWRLGVCISLWRWWRWTDDGPVAKLNTAIYTASRMKSSKLRDSRVPSLRARTSFIVMTQVCNHYMHKAGLVSFMVIEDEYWVKKRDAAVTGILHGAFWGQFKILSLKAECSPVTKLGRMHKLWL